MADDTLGTDFRWEALTQPKPAPDGGVRILHVEPDEAFAKLVRAYLGSKGWDVHWLDDGRKALAAWEDLAPDLLITELQGVDLDGFEFILEVSSMADPPGIVVCTDLVGASTWDAEALATLGVYAVLVRPIRFPELGATLTEALEATRRRWGASA
jgi:DNA-binding response OmpR family regulator